MSKKETTVFRITLVCSISRFTLKQTAKLIKLFDYLNNISIKLMRTKLESATFNTTYSHKSEFIFLKM